MSDSPTPAATPVNLDINVLVDIVKILDHGFQEGIYKGIDTVRAVLARRDSLAAFLESLPKSDAVSAKE